MSKRIFWAVEALGVAGDKETLNTISDAKFVPGVQSVGITTNFNLEQIFELGQLEIYQDLEEVPDIEITVEKVFDQFLSLYARCMDPNTGNLRVRNIAKDQNNQCDIFFSINDDGDEAVGDVNPDAVVHCSGMFVSSASFNFATDGYFTESITLVGNHKKWTVSPGDTMTGVPTSIAAPAAPVQGLDTGEVKKRQNFYFKEMPQSLSNLTALEAAISSASISVDFGREEMNVLGKRLPYHRYVTFPVEVTCEIEAYVTNIKKMAAVGLAGGRLDALPNKDNLTEEQIVIAVTDTEAGDIITQGGANDLHIFDLGSKNKVQSITWGGADTGGSNATITYSYRNFNKLDYRYNGANGTAGLYQWNP